MLEITENEQTFRFTGFRRSAVVSVNRGFSSPVKLTSNLGDDDFLFLMANDGDPFNRWESCQTYAGKTIAGMCRRCQRRQPLRTDAPSRTLSRHADR